MRRLRGMGEVYLAAVFALMFSIGLALFVYTAGRYVKAEYAVSSRALHPPPNVTVAYQAGLLCVNVSSTSLIRQIVVDQGGSYSIVPGGGYHVAGCVSVAATAPTAVVVETSSGSYLYMPGRDPRYAPCAPETPVFRPEDLLRWSSCTRTGGDEALDPVIVEALGYPTAEWFRGYQLAERIIVNGTAPRGYLTSTNNLVNSSGIVFVGASIISINGQDFPRYMSACSLFYDKLPAYKGICGSNGYPLYYNGYITLGFVNTYWEAYQRGVPLVLWYALRLPGPPPGIWVLVGTGYTAAGRPYSTDYLPPYYEASVAFPNGTVVKLEWGTTCVPKSLDLGNISITVDCSAALITYQNYLRVKVRLGGFTFIAPYKLSLINTYSSSYWVPYLGINVTDTDGLGVVGYKVNAYTVYLNSTNPYFPSIFDYRYTFNPAKPQSSFNGIANSYDKPLAFFPPVPLTANVEYAVSLSYTRFRP